MSEKREYKDYELHAQKLLHDYVNSDEAKKLHQKKVDALVRKLFANVGLCAYSSSRHAQLQKARREIAEGSKVCDYCQKPMYKHIEMKDGKLFYTCRLDWYVKPLNSFLPKCRCCGKPLNHHITISRGMCIKCHLARWR